MKNSIYIRDICIRDTFLLLFFILTLVYYPTISTASPTVAHLIHINDHHSHLESESYKLLFDGVETSVTLGGFSRVASKIKELRNTLENPIVLHAGDAIQGTFYYTLYKGEADVKLMNMIGFDAFELGNHEFDDGETVLAKFIKKAEFPVIAANIDASKNAEIAGLFQPYHVSTIKKIGEKVGIIGINTLKTVASSNPSDDVIFMDEVETAKQMVGKLQKQGINKIILLTHYGYHNDIKLAKQVSGVDIIVGGDSHTLLGELKSLGLTTGGSYPTIIQSPTNEPVCIVQAWQNSYAVGKLRVEFDKNGRVTECQGNPILLIGDNFQQNNAKGAKVEVDVATKAKIETTIANNPNIAIVAEDKAVAAQLGFYTKQMANLRNQVIGQAADDLWHIRIPGTHPTGVKMPQGSYIAPLVSEAFFQKLNSMGFEPDLVIQNGGGIRTDLLKGDIIIDTAYRLLPFENTLYILKMTGAEIKQVLEDALTHIWDQNGSTGAFPYGSHISYTITKNQPKNNRVSNIKILSPRYKNSEEIWQALDANKTYKVATYSYLADGKDGYNTFGKIKAERGGLDTYFDYAEAFVDYVKQVKTLKIPETIIKFKYKE